MGARLRYDGLGRAVGARDSAALRTRCASGLNLDGRCTSKIPAAGRVHLDADLRDVPDLDNFVMESTALPRLSQGETIELNAEVFRGEGDAVDAVAKLAGSFIVERSSMVFSGSFGELQAKQHVTLRAIHSPAPAWRTLEYA